MMTRTNIYLTEIQMKKFKAIAKKAGYPVAEIIRRVMDEWLENYEARSEKRKEVKPSKPKPSKKGR
jgi:hypothetical protein